MNLKLAQKDHGFGGFLYIDNTFIIFLGYVFIISARYLNVFLLLLMGD